MEIAELKKILDQHGARIIGKFVRDQQMLVDSLKAEMARSMDMLFPELIRKMATKKEETPKKPKGQCPKEEQK